MVNALAQSAIKDICIFLQRNPDFFSSEDKKSLLEKSFIRYPSIISYLATTDEEEFMSDMREFVAALLAGSSESFDNKLLKTFCSLLVKDLPDLLESSKDLTVENSLDAVISEMSLRRSGQEISQAVSKFIGKYTTIPYIVVQAPIHIENADKKEIRKQMLAKYTYAFPTFTVNKKLIGGMRILVDGQTSDNSWYGRVMNLTHLLHKQA